MSVLPLGILAIWKIKLAGRLLLVVASAVIISSLFQIESKEEASGVLALTFPIVISGLLLLKK